MIFCVHREVSCGRSAVCVSQVREERLAEEKIKKKAAAKKLEEAEARRRHEEEARRQKALQQVCAGARPATRARSERPQPL